MDNYKEVAAKKAKATFDGRRGDKPPQGVGSPMRGYCAAKPGPPQALNKEKASDEQVTERGCEGEPADTALLGVSHA